MRRRACPGSLAPPLVHESAAGDGRQPRPGIVRAAVARPVLGGRDQRVLDSVVGGVEIAGAARQRGEDPRREVAQQVLEIERA